jgi:PucR C-terminal helix-turn-helix domain/GGDEF-like domain
LTVQSPSPVEDPPAIPLPVVDRLLGAECLDDIAAVAAEATRGAVAIVMATFGAAFVGATDDGRLRSVRRYLRTRQAGQPGVLPAGYVTDVPIRVAGADVGAVVLLDCDQPPMSAAEAVLRLAAMAALAVAGAGESGAGRQTQVAAALIEEFSGGTITSDQFLERARRMGCDLARGAVALRASAPPGRAMRAAKLITQVVSGALVGWSGGEVHALLPCDGALADERPQRLVTLLEALATVGISAHQPLPGALHMALREADAALAVVRAGETTAAEAATGTWQLLIHLAASNPSAVQRLVATTIGPALAHDATNGTQLVQTFQTYLGCGANVNATAAAMPAHRHTVSYRLERLALVTGLDPTAMPDQQEQLAVGLKAHRVLTALSA